MNCNHNYEDLVKLIFDRLICVLMLELIGWESYFSLLWLATICHIFEQTDLIVNHKYENGEPTTPIPKCKISWYSLPTSVHTFRQCWTMLDNMVWMCECVLCFGGFSRLQSKEVAHLFACIKSMVTGWKHHLAEAQSIHR